MYILVLSPKPTLRAPFSPPLSLSLSLNISQLSRLSRICHHFDHLFPSLSPLLPLNRIVSLKKPHCRLLINN
ncbi:hypothetical protein HanRHA438_Chr02g0092781 [Helianthus annuus]|nr:hypothetical protein HanRHA438_Chr02g0092781 [Helianthus annuus]